MAKAHEVPNIRVSVGRPQVVTSKTFKSGDHGCDQMSPKNSIGILVGAGSIGKRHAKKLIEQYGLVIVVDPEPSLSNWVETELRSQDLYFSELSAALANIGSNANQATAVIANLGPEHFSTFNQLADAGIKRILCEKPMAVSIKQIDVMIARIKSDNILFTVGIQRRYTDLCSVLRSIGEKYLGGKPVAVVGHGGAQCLITTGMHWIDLCIDLFQDNPKAVSAIAHPQKISPRSPLLEMWSGTAAWAFSNNRYLTLTYSNSSSVEGELVIYCPTGRIEIDPNGVITMHQRKSSEVLTDKRITRVGEALSSGVIEINPQVVHPTIQMLNELDTGVELTYSTTAAAIAANAALGLLISATTKHEIQLPVSNMSEYYGFEWSVT